MKLNTFAICNRTTVDVCCNFIFQVFILLEPFNDDRNVVHNHLSEDKHSKCSKDYQVTVARSYELLTCGAG